MRTLQQTLDRLCEDTLHALIAPLRQVDAVSVEQQWNDIPTAYKSLMKAAQLVASAEMGHGLGRSVVHHDCSLCVMRVHSEVHTAAVAVSWRRA